MDLKPNGRKIPVTNDNKLEYVKLINAHKLTKSIEKQIDNFLTGFHEFIPPELISFFNDRELELLIRFTPTCFFPYCVSGLPEIDIEDLRVNTEYHTYTQDSVQIKWFWQTVREFSPQERAQLLQFVTGSSKVPLGGFAALSGMHGITKVKKCELLF